MSEPLKRSRKKVQRATKIAKLTRTVVKQRLQDGSIREIDLAELECIHLPTETKVRRRRCVFIADHNLRLAAGYTFRPDGKYYAPTKFDLYEAKREADLMAIQNAEIDALTD